MDSTLLAGYPVIVELPVVWGEMDSYQHVNNVVYFRYFENVRLEYFRRMDWFEFERQTGIGPILSATQARFRKPLTYPDTISVGARIPKLEEDRFTMEYLLVSQKEPRIEQFIRQPDGHWLLAEAVGLGKSLELPSLKITISLAEIFLKVNFLPASIRPSSSAKTST